jgi:integrase
MATHPASSSTYRPQGRIAARSLTEAAVRALKAGQSRSDGALPVGNGRLVMTCTKVRGRIRRTWTFRVRKEAQNAEVVLGEHPAISLDEARKRAVDFIQRVRDGAALQDAAGVREATKLPSPAPPRGASLRTLLESYAESLRQDGKASARDVGALFSRHVFDPWPDLAATPAADLDATHVRDILARMVQMGIRRQTNILRSYLQAAFTHGAHADLDPRRPNGESSRFRLAGNPVSFVPRITEFEAVRDRVLSDDELRRLWADLDRLRPEVALTFRCAIFLGGQRFKQLLRSTWQDYDADGRVLTLLDAKGRRKAPMPHLLPVSPRVAAFLDQLRAFNGHGSYIFSTNAGKTPIHTATLSVSFAALRASRSANSRQAPMQARDLRRSVETRLQALGVEREVRAQLLSHGRTSGVQQRHYERHDFLAEKAAALALLEDHILGLVQPKARKSSGRSDRGPASAKNSVANSVAKRQKEKTG